MTYKSGSILRTQVHWLVISSLALFIATAGFGANLEAFQKAYPEKFAELNSEEVWGVRYTPESLDQLRVAYQELPLSMAFQRIYLDPQSTDAQLLKPHPEIITWNSDRSALLVPNIKYMEPTKLKQHAKTKTLRHLKDIEPGLSLNWWIIPKKLGALSHFIGGGLKGVTLEQLSRLRGTDIGTGTGKFYATILDLEPSDLTLLRDLQRSLSTGSLGKIFGVDPKKDDVRQFIHFPTAPRNSVLHVHVRVNQAAHGADLDRSYSLEEIIETFEKGKTIKDLLLARQERLGLLPFGPGEESTLEILRKVRGLEIYKIKNPRRIEDLNKKYSRKSKGQFVEQGNCLSRSLSGSLTPKIAAP